MIIGLIYLGKKYTDGKTTVTPFGFNHLGVVCSIDNMKTITVGFKQFKKDYSEIK